MSSRGNINERVARLLAAVPTLEGDNMEMEEDNSFTNRKRKYQSVKRQETTGTYVHMFSCPAILFSCTFLFGHLRMWV
jgi:hypothetical protein